MVVGLLFMFLLCNLVRVNRRFFVITTVELLQLNEKVPFSHLLENSLQKEQTTQAWCDQCNKYKTHVGTSCYLSKYQSLCPVVF